jgi:hypothetical protein
MEKANKVAEYGSPIQKCHLVPVSQITLIKNKDGQVRYGGLSTCRNSWACPICTPRRASERAEIVSGIARQIVNTPVMVTYTLQHKRGDDLNDLLNTLQMALRVARNGSRLAAYNRYCLGYIRALEITYGHANGWHPHYHELNFLNRGMTMEGMTKTVIKSYRKAIEKSGRVINEFTVDCKPWDQTTDYLTKGMELTKELTHGRLKDNGKSLNIFDILDMVGSGSPNNYNSLYAEYVKATHRRKVIVTSRSLDKWRLIAEERAKQDKEDGEKDDKIIGVLTRKEFKDISKAGLRLEILVKLSD